MKLYHNKITVLVTGGFDPIHSGHINLFKKSSQLGYKLVVGINSDEWLIRKKKYFFLPLNERRIIIENLRMVDEVIVWDDKDNSACGAINILLSKLPINEFIIFANGGDRKKSNIPELSKFKNEKRVLFKFGIGGFNKKNSSSLIINNYFNKFKIMDCIH